MTPYEQGFLSKCAEYGVDGFELLKQAKEQANYAGPLGGIAAAGGGVLGALASNIDNAGGRTVENAAEYASALKTLGKDIGKYVRHGLSVSYFSPEQIDAIQKGTGNLLSNPGWMRQATRDVRLANIGDWLKVGGGVAGGAALLGIPAYGIAKIVQNVARRNKE